MTNQQPHATGNTSEPADQKQGGSDNPRLEASPSGGEIHAPKADTKHRKATQEDKHWLEYATGTFAFIAAIGAIIAAIFTGWQAWIASDTEARQLRAYVHVTGGTMSYTPKANSALEVTIRPGVKVFGATPAGGLTVPWNVKVEEWPMTDGFKFDYLKSRMQSTSSQAPGEERPIGEITATVTPDEIKQIDAGISRLYAYGTILYVDIFRKVRYTNFCWYFDVPAIQRMNGSDCPIHNGADWNNSSEPLKELAVVPMK